LRSTFGASFLGKARIALDPPIDDEEVCVWSKSGRALLAEVSLGLGVESVAEGFEFVVVVEVGVELEPKFSRSLSPKRVSELLNEEPKSKSRLRSCGGSDEVE